MAVLLRLCCVSLVRHWFFDPFADTFCQLCGASAVFFTASRLTVSHPIISARGVLMHYKSSKYFLIYQILRLKNHAFILHLCGVAVNSTPQIYKLVARLNLSHTNNRQRYTPAIIRYARIYAPNSGLIIANLCHLKKRV